ncbi:MAG: disulfide bond formation protein B [Chlamydiota bacterium]
MNSKKLYLYLAWLLSCISLVVSLYFSEVKHIHPCTLCWYQRIAIFPLVILLGIALYQEFLGIFSYVIAFPFLSAIFSGWQIAMQEFPNLHLRANCAPEISCATKYVIAAGISLPMLTFGYSCIMIILLFLSRLKPNSTL